MVFMYLFLAVLGLHCSTGFSLVVEREGYSLVAACRASHCGGVSWCGACALGPVDSRVGSGVAAPRL